MPSLYILYKIHIGFFFSFSFYAILYPKLMPSLCRYRPEPSLEKMQDEKNIYVFSIPKI